MHLYRPHKNQLHQIFMVHLLLVAARAWTDRASQLNPPSSILVDRTSIAPPLEDHEDIASLISTGRLAPRAVESPSPERENPFLAFRSRCSPRRNSQA
eukprot:5809709-Pyramimonas_sp.AAC.1